MRRFGAVVGLVIGATGCGGGGGTPSPDSQVPDARPGARLDVTVLDPAGTGTPDPFATVLFYDASDVFLYAVPTDPLGQAHGNVGDGGSVTVVQGLVLDTLRDMTITTIRGVAAGDHLQIGERSLGYLGGSTQPMTLSFTPPAGTVPPLEIFTGCGAGEQIYLRPSCADPSFPLLATATDSGGTRRALWAPEIPPMPGQTYPVTGTWNPLAPATVTLDNTPGGADLLHAGWFTLVGEEMFESDHVAVDAPAPGTNTLQPLRAAGAGTATLVVAYLDGGDTAHTFPVHTAQPVDTATFDLAALPLPEVSGAVQGLDTVTWSTSGAPAGDARYVIWLGNWADASGAHDVRWTVVEPPGLPPTTTLPRLPPPYDLDDPRTDPDEVALAGAFVTYVDHDRLAGYDEARLEGTGPRKIGVRFVEGEQRAHFVTTPR